MKRLIDMMKAAALCSAAMCMMTSCLDGENDQHSAYGYFTVTGNQTLGYTLYQDGGGFVIPTAQSVSDLTNGKGLGDVERALLSFTYQEKDVAQDKNSITGAKLYSGESLPVYDLLSTKAATEQHVLDADSTFAVGGISGLWVYRGYMTLIYSGQYAWNKDKNGYLYPVTNLVYDAEQQIPNELSLQLCHNEHRTKDEMPAGKRDFVMSFRLKDLQGLVPGQDSIKMSLKVLGIEKPYQIKVAREDLIKGNWR